jgi:hypothetical protein
VFSGSLDQIAQDVRACDELGANELFFELTFTPTTGSAGTGRRLA